MSQQFNLESECRRQAVRFWGRKYVITPRLVDWIHGDGRQIIYLTPLATRPNYYVVRIDSKIDLSNYSDNMCFADEVLDDLIDAIEDQFGRSYEEWEHDNGRTYKRHNPFPALNYDCGSAWGKIAMLSSPATIGSQSSTATDVARKES